jgi:WXG100 family type VII secretion target
VAGGYDVQHDSMVRGAQAIDETSGVIRSLLSTLDNEFLTLKASWRGTGAQSFDRVSAQWAAQQRQLVEALDAMHVALVGTHQQYIRQEEATADQFSQVASSL